MKKAFKIFGYTVLGLITLLFLIGIFFMVKWNRTSVTNMELLGKEATILSENGFEYRDLNKNGKLDIYEDSRANIENRIDDLISQMTLEEKAGLMFITMIGMNDDGSLQERPILSEPFSFFF